MNGARNIDIRIDRVIVETRDGVAANAAQIQTAIETELVRLLSDNVPDVGSRLDRHVAVMDNALAQRQSALGMGETIARAIHEAVQGTR